MEETPTPTPELSDAQANRIKLIRYLRNNGTRDDSGNWSVDDKTTRNNGLVMTKVSTDGEFLFFSCGSGMEASDGTIMTSVVTVVCGVEQDLAAANCIVVAKTSYGTSLEDSMVKTMMTTADIVSENNHLSWTVEEKNGTLFTRSELCELADTTMDLFYPWTNILLMIKCGGMTLEDLGFGS